MEHARSTSISYLLDRSGPTKRRRVATSQRHSSTAPQQANTQRRIVHRGDNWTGTTSQWQPSHRNWAQNTANAVNTITTNHNVATNSSWRASCGIKTDRAKQASRQASKRANWRAEERRAKSEEWRNNCNCELQQKKQKRTNNDQRTVEEQRSVLQFCSFQFFSLPASFTVFSFEKIENRKQKTENSEMAKWQNDKVTKWKQTIIQLKLTSNLQHPWQYKNSIF